MREQIERLLTAPASGAEAPTLARMEDTLTEGYAQALALEAERWRLERRIGEVARTVEGLDVSSFADELTEPAQGHRVDLGRGCQRSPAPGYPEEERAVAECIGVVMDEEIEHYRFAVRDLAVLEAR